MIFFIVFLRFSAACLITNSHFVGVYPFDQLANGGLLGDVIFFAVSGYCLFNPNRIFPLWYGKRIIRCYLPVLLITAIYMVLGFYSLSTQPFWWWYLWPTNYHFVASIILLYIPFYIFMKVKPLQDRISLLVSIIAIAYMFVYILTYDKSYYHIDNVREPMIEFLFIEAMLLGAWFRKNDMLFRNKFHWYVPVITLISFITYFASKSLFTKYQSLAFIQPINQIFLFVLVFLIFWTCSSLDEKMNKMPRWIKAPIMFVSEMTLEIYVVQYVLIDLIGQCNFVFPLNWFVLVLSILTAGSILHFFCRGILFLLNLLLSKLPHKESEPAK